MRAPIFTPEDARDLRLLAWWVVTCIGACALGFVLAALGPALDEFDAWRARAAGVQQQVQDEAWLRAWQQSRMKELAAHRARTEAACGPENACRPGPAGTGVCVTRRGLRTSTPCQLAHTASTATSPVLSVYASKVNLGTEQNHPGRRVLAGVSGGMQ